MIENEEQQRFIDRLVLKGNGLWKCKTPEEAKEKAEKLDRLLVPHSMNACVIRETEVNAYSVRTEKPEEAEEEIAFGRRNRHISEKFNRRIKQGYRDRLDNFLTSIIRK